MLHYVLDAVYAPPTVPQGSEGPQDNEGEEEKEEEEGTGEVFTTLLVAAELSSIEIELYKVKDKKL